MQRPDNPGPAPSPAHAQRWLLSERIATGVFGMPALPAGHSLNNWRDADRYYRSLLEREELVAPCGRPSGLNHIALASYNGIWVYGLHVCVNHTGRGYAPLLTNTRYTSRRAALEAAVTEFCGALQYTRDVGDEAFRDAQALRQWATGLLEPQQMGLL